METNPLMTRMLKQAIIIMHNDIEDSMIIINKNIG